MNPLIGATCNFFDTSFCADNARIMVLPDQSIYAIGEDYMNSIEQAGGVSMVLPATTNLNLIKDYVERCDGFLIVGAVADVNPMTYGEAPSQFVQSPTQRNDDFDLALAKYVIYQTNKPLMGICRGTQVINVAMGGTLTQDLVSNGYQQHCILTKPKNCSQHQVTVVDKDSFVYRVFQSDSIAVNSLHHQAIKDLAPGLRATSLSEDGVVESCEMTGGHLVVGFQWHPEMMYDDPVQQRIFSHFVQACAQQKKQ